MSVKIVIGAQWGDEGKGKLVDYLSEHAEIVARYQGGANAGHTVHVKDKKYILHLIPGGILRPDVTCLIGNGVVFDPEAFFEEVGFLATHGISVEKRLFISERAHVIFPYHKLIDQASEETLNHKKIGTTGKGIGPAYVDKFNRSGIRVIDLFDDSRLPEILQENVEQKSRILVENYGQPPLNYEAIIENTRNFAEKLLPFVADTSEILYRGWRAGRQILLEGAQGCLLDIDFGSYPYVTSSNPTSGGSVIGTGLPPSAIGEIVGVVKAYTTRVGSGPFPTECLDNIGELLREQGHEYGATTGRPRRCGWFDGVAMQYASRINGFTALALTKLDVLTGFKKIGVCRSYRFNGEERKTFPAATYQLENCTADIEMLDGWEEDVSVCRRYADLPENARIYVETLEKISGVPIKYVSVGVERDQIIAR
jgi:adenylosuccinate synthase